MAEPTKHWRYYLPYEKGEGYAIIFIDSTGVFSAVSNFGNYGYIWGNTGKRSIKEFLLESEKDWHYFAKKLDPKGIVDWEATEKRILEHIKENRKEGNYTKEFADREVSLLWNNPLNGWSFACWCQDTKLHDPHEFQVRRLSFQVELFVKTTMKRLCVILKKELSEEAADEQGRAEYRANLKQQFATQPKHCPKHPKYRAIYTPRVDCDGCRRYYQEKNGVTSAA